MLDMLDEQTQTNSGGTSLLETQNPDRKVRDFLKPEEPES